MTSHTVKGIARVAILSIVALGLAACASVQRTMRSSALDYLYPTPAAAEPAREVSLKLPVRVGIAFAPPKVATAGGPSEDQKRTLLERTAAAFRDRKGIAGVDVIPSSSLQPGGGFADLDRVRQAFGIDVVALVSYDQFQFSETTRASWTYWTIVGAYLVKGEKNETRTVLDAVVYDIPSRALLFTASGDSRVGGRSTPIDVVRDMRTASERGFSLAVDALIPKLDTALAAFQEQAKAGTVRGVGTPAITMTPPPGAATAGRSGGSAGAIDLALALLLAGAAAWGGSWRTRRRA